MNDISSGLRQPPLPTAPGGLRRHSKGVIRDNYQCRDSAHSIQSQHPAQSYLFPPALHGGHTLLQLDSEGHNGLCKKHLVARRTLAQRRKDAKRYRVSKSFSLRLCAFAPLRLCARKMFRTEVSLSPPSIGTVIQRTLYREYA